MHKTRQCRAGQDRALQGEAGQDTAVQGRAGQDAAVQGGAGQNAAVQGRTQQCRAGQGRRGDRPEEVQTETVPCTGRWLCELHLQPASPQLDSCARGGLVHVRSTDCHQPHTSVQTHKVGCALKWFRRSAHDWCAHRPQSHVLMCVYMYIMSICTCYIDAHRKAMQTCREMTN